MSRWSAPPPFLRAMRALGPIAAGAVLLSSCVGQPDADPQSGTGADGGVVDEEGAPGSTGSADPVATAPYHVSAEGIDLRFHINSLERYSDDMVVLTMSVTNDGDEATRVTDSLSEEGGQPSTPDGVSLIDTANEQRYMPLNRSDGETCHCSTWSGEESVEPGGRIETWVAFPAPPQDVEFVTVTTPVTPDFLDIPITDAESPDSSIADAPVAEPRVLGLRAFQDDVEGGTSRADSGDETTILLSSDVLFELNESALTPEADDILRQVAEEIDNASATTVEVDGYTDNTGSDAINDPLSEDRAASVEERLQELVTREGVGYEVAGHGSADPVGDNRTDEGREKNRRVTITFAK
ncbi:OmpA family protein [Marinactinospora rubrisoli]|uniref:OmpA family protein n=1 Tax=Marinactinospora rubrisoli TaxID=2715399 RepID=A0ABW2KKS6_9ACTN